MHSIKDRSTFQTCRLRKALSASGLRFARHGASDQQNGTAKHQSIPQIIKAIVDTGEFCDGDWYVDQRTPRLLHFSNLANTSSVRKTIPVERPMSLYSSESGRGASSKSTAVPSGGVTASDRSGEASGMS